MDEDNDITEHDTFIATRNALINARAFTRSAVESDTAGAIHFITSVPTSTAIPFTYNDTHHLIYSVIDDLLKKVM